MPVEIVNLAELPELVARQVASFLARVHAAEWGHLYPAEVWNVDIARVEFEEMSAPASVDQTLLAFDGPRRSLEDLLGSVSLLRSDAVEGWEALGPWLAGLYVVAAARRRGIGAELTDACVGAAAVAGHNYVHLFSPEHEQYYARRGWRAIGRVVAEGHDASVMIKGTSPFAARRSVASSPPSIPSSGHGSRRLLRDQRVIPTRDEHPRTTRPFG